MTDEEIRSFVEFFRSKGRDEVIDNWNPDHPCRPERWADAIEQLMEENLQLRKMLEDAVGPLSLPPRPA